MADLTGHSFGRYHLLEKLGEGGMAIVYKAYDTRLEVDVAVKVIQTDNFPQNAVERALKRFEREAKSLARLTHPNIVKVTDYGEYEGKPYLVMPYLPGGTLKTRLGKPMVWAEAVTLLLPIAEALEFAHSQGMIHRDVKPANILITQSGRPMLSDFGIAKILDLDKNFDLTGTNAAIGTPEYMAPEQASAKNVDHRADIYALGIVLYEMVTGRKPFMADTPMAVLIKHATEPLPRPKKFMPTLPDRAEKILIKALAKIPADRYQSMAEFSSALQQSVEKTKIIRPSKPARTEPLVIEDKTERVVFTNVIETPAHVTNQNVKVGQGNWRKWLPLGALVIVLCLALATGNRLLGSGTRETDQPEGTATETAASTSTSTPTKTLTPTITFSPTLGIGTTLMSETDGMTLLFVPAGEFTMGSDTSDQSDEKPEHQVNLDAFWIDQTEVTNVMYFRCVGARVCAPPRSSESYSRPNYYGISEFDNYPVIYVDWNQAKDYCEWAGRRLPTEAEWEKAARGIDGPTYPWGENIDSTFANYNGNVGDTTAVGSYASGQSPYGLYDMAGNVWEWVSSLYKPYPYSATDGREDLSSTDARVLRGGSWYFYVIFVRSAVRYRNTPGITVNYVGFRCARSLD